jgi:hypothetical protein
LPNQNKTTKKARDTEIIAGVTKNLKGAASLPLAGASYTPVALITLVQSRINAMAAVAAARANWLDAAKSLKVLNAQVDEVEAGLKSYVINVYGKTSPVLADFGFALKQRAVPTVAEKQQAVQKRAATRAARGTASAKAKSQIHGTVETTAPETATAPAAPIVPPTAPTPSATAPQKS